MQLLSDLEGQGLAALACVVALIGVWPFSPCAPFFLVGAPQLTAAGGEGRRMGGSPENYRCDAIYL